MSPNELKKYKMAAAERKRKSRMLKKQKEIESEGNAVSENQTTSSTSPSTSYQPFERPQSLGKAMKRSIRALPQSPRKRKAVVRGLAKRFAVNVEKELESNLSTNGNALSEEVTSTVSSFFFRSDVSYTMPGLKDEMTVWKNGKKQRLRKHYLTMFLREAYAVFREIHPSMTIGFSTFCRLRTANVLLLKNTPKDQCKCKTHENFRMKLKALDSKLVQEGDCWNSILCDASDLQSNCWTGACETCKEGKVLEAKLSSKIDLAQETEWYQWENDTNEVLRKQTKRGCMLWGTLGAGTRITSRSPGTHSSEKNPKRCV